MKVLKFALTAFLFIGLMTACDKNNLTDDVDALVQEIAFSNSKEEIATTELPAETLQFIKEEYFETYIERAFRVEGRGYEVRLGDEEILYFDTRGRHLRPERHPFGHGPCGRGEIIGPEELPQIILDYIAENYPDANIFRAKHKPGRAYLVGIEGGLILIFNGDGEFVEAATHFYHCHPLGVRIPVEDLPEVIVNYVNDNYPNPEIKVAFQKTNGNYIIGIITDDGRKILGFDENGNLLFERP